MSRRVPVLAVALALLACACTSSRQSSPPRTATEQLLVSRAADAAAQQLDLALPPGTRIWLDARALETGDGFVESDARYAVGAIRDHLLAGGARLASQRDEAEVVVLVRAGALSVDERERMLGIPSFDIPVPLAGSFTFPGLAVFREDERQGVAKLVATAVDAETGTLIDSTGPRFGFSHKRRWMLLLLLSGASDDLLPKAAPAAEDGVAPEPPRP